MGCLGQHPEGRFLLLLLCLSVSLSLESCLISASLGSSWGPILGYILTLVEDLTWACPPAVRLQRLITSHLVFAKRPWSLNSTHKFPSLGFTWAGDPFIYCFCGLLFLFNTNHLFLSLPQKIQNTRRKKVKSIQCLLTKKIIFVNTWCTSFYYMLLLGT